MLTQYENNKTHSVVTMVMKRQMRYFYREKIVDQMPLGGRFEFPISADLLYGMSFTYTESTLWPPW
jgi:hypothetical protein